MCIYIYIYIYIMHTSSGSLLLGLGEKDFDILHLIIVSACFVNKIFWCYSVAKLNVWNTFNDLKHLKIIVKHEECFCGFSHD